MMIFKRYMLRERILSNVDLHHCKWNLLIIRKNIYEDFLKCMHNLTVFYFLWFNVGESGEEAA